MPRALTNTSLYWWSIDFRCFTSLFLSLTWLYQVQFFLNLFHWAEPTVFLVLDLTQFAFIVGERVSSLISCINIVNRVAGWKRTCSRSFFGFDVFYWSHNSFTYVLPFRLLCFLFVLLVFLYFVLLITCIRFGRSCLPAAASWSFLHNHSCIQGGW